MLTAFKSSRDDQLSKLKQIIADKKSGKTIINVIGKTGSGKGTQCIYLSAKTGLPHISIGDLFRNEEKNSTVLNELIEFHDRNRPPLELPDEVWFGLLLQRLSQPDCYKGYILDNFPRTAKQARIIVNTLMRPDDMHIPIYMDVNDETIKKRLKGRLMCPKCRTQVREHDGDTHGGICSTPDCNGEKLQYRLEDRDEQKMNERLDTFKRNIDPLIQEIQKRDFVYYIKINDNESPQQIASIFEMILLERLTIPPAISTRSSQSLLMS